MNDVTSTLVEMICDLRQVDTSVDNIGSIEGLWQRVGRHLVKQQMNAESPISVTLPEGQVLFWVVDAHGLEQIQDDTSFEIVDVLRNPKLLYKCVVCQKYGPLRCAECAKENRETRLCSKDAHMIKDKLSAYCPDHIPVCNCRKECKEKAVFQCTRCHRLYGEHQRKTHIKDPDVDYCLSCFRHKFETCQEPGCTSYGKSKCAYQILTMHEPCGKPSCSLHSYQWKIWGPHNRGVALCGHHSRVLAESDPKDLLFMMLTAQAPYSKRGQKHSLPNPFRLRRTLNRNRSLSLTFEQIGETLRSIESDVLLWGKRAEKNYRYMARNFFETVEGLDKIESELLIKIKDHYRSILGSSAVEYITGLEVTDRFYKPGSPPTYLVRLSISPYTDKGKFIGRNGAYINPLRERFNIKIDLV